MDQTRYLAALFGDVGPAGETIQSVYGEARLRRLEACVPLYPRQLCSKNFEVCVANLPNLEMIFGTWGLPKLSDNQLDGLPSLRAVFYAGGSVKYFAEPLLERGITVVSGWAANAVPVAEFTLGQILLSNKGYFRNVAEYAAAGSLDVFRGEGNFERTVSVLGAGQIGRKVIELLRPFHMRVLVFDPFLSYKGAEALGVEKSETLDEAFERGDIVTNHLADVAETRNLLRGEHFRRLPLGATFINTGRGATVHQTEMTEVLQLRTDVTALLDVTEPEPLPAAHPMRKLPNVHISGHIAGSIGKERMRVADYVLEDLDNWLHHRPLRFAVTSQMLERMA